MLNLKKNSVENDSIVIGGPLSDGFRTLYDIPDEETLAKAIDIYRNLYANEGITKFSAYNGIDTALSKLKSDGYQLGVATLKLEEYAKSMLKNAELAKYFDIIHGWDGTEKCTKAYTVTKVLFEQNVLQKTLCLSEIPYMTKTVQKLPELIFWASPTVLVSKRRQNQFKI